MDEKKWISIYTKEEKTGVAILQYMIAAEEEQQILYLTGKVPDVILGSVQGEEEQPEIKSESPKDLAELKKDYEKKLSELHQAYWLHQVALGQLVSEKPKGPYIREWELKRRRKRGKMTLAWVEEQKACAAKGGCCGRDSGCCEKLLGTYPEPTSPGLLRFLKNKKKVKPIYGHCSTYYCQCCVKSRGFSKLNPGFTESVNKRYGRKQAGTVNEVQRQCMLYLT